MSSDAYMVSMSEGDWRIASVAVGGRGAARVERVEAPAEAGLSGRARAAAAKLREWGAEGRSVVLGVPSSWCLSAVISTDALDRTGRRRAMLYRLEEHLPISAEEVTADFVELGDGEALGVCAQTARLRAVVDELEQAGIRVGPICPTALLAAGRAARMRIDAEAVLLVEGRSGDTALGDAGGSSSEQPVCDLVELRQGRPVRWWWFGHDTLAARQRIAGLSSSGERALRVALLGAEGLPRSPEPGGSATLEVLPIAGVDVDGAAALESAELLSGRTEAWADLRRESLAAPERWGAYRGALIAVSLALALLLSCVIAAAQWRIGQHDRLRRQARADQVEVYQRVMSEAGPDGRSGARVRTPSSEQVLALLTRERRRLAGLSGQGSDAATAALLAAPSALTRLTDLLAHLPADLRYRILELSIQPELIRVEGEAMSHAQAERLAVSLRGSGLFTVDSPRTQLLGEGGVSFLFTARPTPGASGIAASGSPANGRTAAGGGR